MFVVSYLTFWTDDVVNLVEEFGLVTFLTIPYTEKEKTRKDTTSPNTEDVFRDVMSHDAVVDEWVKEENDGDDVTLGL